MSLKHRETLIRGMGKRKLSIQISLIIFLFKKQGVVDMCHRVLFGTSGTMANLPLATNNIIPLHGQAHSMVSIRFL
jgi:hypothetical protein